MTSPSSSSPPSKKASIAQTPVSANTKSSPTKNSSTPVRKSSRDLLVDTMVGMRELAVESVSGFKEWASSPEKSQDDSSNGSMDELKRLLYSSPRPNNNPKSKDSSSPEKAVDSLYGETTNYESVSLEKEQKQQPRHGGLVHDLMSPFLACSGGFGAAVQNSKPKEALTKVKTAVSKVMPSSPPKKPKPQEQENDEDVLSEEGNTNNYASKYLSPRLPSALFMDPSASDETEEDSLDSQLEDELYQIQRLTSWNTYTTEATYGTHVTYETLLTEGTGPDRVIANNNLEPKGIMATTDDDGNVIPPALVEKVKQKQKLQRKRVVQFDYPPIRSVKECPRVAPEDLEKLFFTEEELDQFEDDRCSTRLADDVEIVAVASPLSDDVEEFDNSASRKPFSKYKGTPKLKRKKQVEPPPPVLTTSSDSSHSDEKKKARKQKSPPAPESSRKRANSNDGSVRRSPRLLKGVQIYMRERSTGSFGGKRR